MCIELTLDTISYMTNQTHRFNDMTNQTHRFNAFREFYFPLHWNLRKTPKPNAKDALLASFVSTTEALLKINDIVGGVPGLSRAARITRRPIRPKPLIPKATGMVKFFQANFRRSRQQNSDEDIFQLIIYENKRQEETE